MNDTCAHNSPIDISKLMPDVLAWTRSINADAMLRGKALASWQVADAVEVGVRKPEAVRLVFLPSLPEPDPCELRTLAGECGLDFSRSSGVAFGYAVLIRQDALGDRRVLRHELRHVAQFEAAGGLTSFIEEYLGQLARHGYQYAPLEIDARNHESRFPNSGIPRG